MAIQNGLTIAETAAIAQTENWSRWRILAVGILWRRIVVHMGMMCMDWQIRARSRFMVNFDFGGIRSVSSRNVHLTADGTDGIFCLVKHRVFVQRIHILLVKVEVIIAGVKRMMMYWTGGKVTRSCRISCKTDKN